MNYQSENKYEPFFMTHFGTLFDKHLLTHIFSHHTKSFAVHLHASVLVLSLK